MTQISQSLSVEHSLWSGALADASKGSDEKITDLEKSKKIGENSLTELRQKYQEFTNLIGRLDSQVITLKGKYKNAKIKNEQLKEEVNQLKDEKSTLEEKLRPQKECHRVELESLCQSCEEIFRKFREDTKKNFSDALFEWRSNLILHAQVATSPLDLSHVNFNCLRDISSVSLNFKVYHPDGEE